MINIDATYFGQKVLITGGFGFIGSNLAHKLVNLGAVVTVLDNLDPDSGANLFNVNDISEKVKFICADINDDDQIRLAVKDQAFLFNLAGQGGHLKSMQDPFKDLNVNAVGQIRLLETCRINNPQIRIVFAGTRQVYGSAKYLPVDENHLLNPIDNNGISKQAGEMYHLVYGRVYGMTTSVLRMTNVYGPRMRIKDNLLNFIGEWFRRVLLGQEIQIFGDGNQIRDLNHVDDVINALLLSAIAPTSQGKIYNLGGKPITLLELARLLIQINGSGTYSLVPFPESRKRIDIGDYHGDYSLIQADLGWQPQVQLNDGLARSLEFYRSNMEHYL